MCNTSCCTSSCNCKPTPHKHAAVIKAWADGKEIEVRGGMSYPVWIKTTNPSWDNCCYEFRVKPEPRPDIVKYARDLGQGAIGHISNHHDSGDRVKFIWDGETLKLKSVELI